MSLKFIVDVKMPLSFPQIWENSWVNVSFVYKTSSMQANCNQRKVMFSTNNTLHKTTYYDIMFSVKHFHSAFILCFSSDLSVCMFECVGIWSYVLFCIVLFSINGYTL